LATPSAAINPFDLFLWRLDVKFQEVVVHSSKNCEADVAKQKLSQEAEWTTTIMLD
jgi:hypothetical protein